MGAAPDPTRTTRIAVSRSGTTSQDGPKRHDCLGHPLRSRQGAVDHRRAAQRADQAFCRRRTIVERCRSICVAPFAMARPWHGLREIEIKTTPSTRDFAVETMGIEPHDPLLAKQLRTTVPIVRDRWGHPPIARRTSTAVCSQLGDHGTNSNASQWFGRTTAKSR